MRRSYGWTSLFCFFLFVPQSHGSMGYYEEDTVIHPSRASGFTENIEMSANDLQGMGPMAEPFYGWDQVFTPDGLKDDYEKALDLEGKGEYSNSAKLFRRIDEDRKFDNQRTRAIPEWNLAFREAQDRVELYTIARLKHPQLLKLYLVARAAYVQEKYQDATGLFRTFVQADAKADPKDLLELHDMGEFLVNVCRAKAQASVENDQALVDFVNVHPSPRFILTLASTFYFGSDVQEVKEEEIQLLLKEVFQKHPASRYADDAVYLLASMAIDDQDWDESRRYFQLLAEKFNDDDMVAKGRLESLADRAAEKFQKSSRMQAFYELAGGTGDYADQEEQWNKLKPFYRPYFILDHVSRLSGPNGGGYRLSSGKKHKIKKVAVAAGMVAAALKTATPEAESVDDTVRLLRMVIDQYPKHPLRPKAMMRLVIYYQHLNQNRWNTPPDTQTPRKVAELCKELIDNYPKSDEAGPGALAGLISGGQGNDWKFAMASWIEKVYRYHPIPEGILQSVGGQWWDGRKMRPGPKIHFKNPKLNDMFLVANGSPADILQKAPQSPFAPGAFLNLYNAFQTRKYVFERQEQKALNKAQLANQKKERVEARNQYLKPMLFFLDWYLKNRSKWLMADVLRVKQAKLWLDSGEPAKALRAANSILEKIKKEEPPPESRGWSFHYASWTMADAAAAPVAYPMKKAKKRHMNRAYGLQSTPVPKLQGIAKWKDEVLWVRARALEELGHGPEAIKTYEELLALFPHQGPAFGETTPGNQYQFYYQQNNQSQDSSAYTAYAYGRVGLYYEKKKDFVSAFKTYAKAGDISDCEAMLDSILSLDDMTRFMADNPDNPANPAVEKAMGMRYFRLRQYDKALAILKDYPEAAQVKEVKGIYADLEKPMEPEEKAKSEYRIAQSFFHGNYQAPYFSYAMVDKPAAGPTAPTKDWLQRAGSMELAAEGFQRIVDLYPQSPLRDRALYSYSLCRLHFSSHYYGDAEGKDRDDVVDHFARIAKELPQSTLADDGLLWAHFFSGDDKYLVDLFKDANHGDVPLLLNLQDVGDSRGYYWDQPNSWSFFFKHNDYLVGTDLSDKPQGVLLGSQLTDHFNQGGPLTGWYYYRATGKGPYEATLDLTLAGAEGSKALINFNGRETALDAGAPKNFHVKVPGLPCGVAQWVYFRVEECGETPITVTGSLDSQVDGLSFESPLDPVTAAPQTMTLTYQTKDYPVDKSCVAETASDLNGTSYTFALKRSDGKTQVYSARGQGVQGNQVCDLDIDQFLGVRSGQLFLHHLSEPLGKKVPVATGHYWGQWVSQGVTMQGDKAVTLFPMAPYGRYAHGVIQEEDGYLVDDRGEKIAKLPEDAVERKTRNKLRGPGTIGEQAVPEVSIEHGDPTKGTEEKLVISGLGQFGIGPDVRFCQPGPEKVLAAHFLGYDHQGKVYFYLRCPADDKIQAFFPGGRSAGFFWLKDKMTLVDDFHKLKSVFYSGGRIRIYSFLPDKKVIRFDDFLFDYVPSPYDRYE